MVSQRSTRKLNSGPRIRQKGTRFTARSVDYWDTGSSASRGQHNLDRSLDERRDIVVNTIGIRIPRFSSDIKS